MASTGTSVADGAALVGRDEDYGWELPFVLRSLPISFTILL